MARKEAPPPRTGLGLRSRLGLGLAVGSGLALAFVLVWWFLQPGAGPAIVRTPDQNILLITIDTLRADALSCAGGRAATPNLDRLASLGTRFSFAHAHAVVTLPSHASILTGLYPFEHGVHDNAGFTLSSRFPTLATRLREKGYATGAFVGAFAVDSRFGLNAGFDVYDDKYGKSNMASGFRMAERRADTVVAAATTWIAQQKGRWLAWVHVFDPHGPYEPPPPFDSQYRESPYHGEVAFTDAALGPLLDAARDASGRPTLIIVTGDHGEGLGEHGEATHGLFAYEPTLKIPLILAQVAQDTPAVAAGSAPAFAASPLRRGKASDIPARHVDLVPTVLDALALPPVPSLPGLTLIGPDAAKAPRPSYFESLTTMLNRGWAPLTGVLADGRKYIELPLPELYELPSDPGEQTNLVDRERQQARVLESRLRAFGADAPGARQEETAEARARLQALGYISGSAPRKARYTEEDDPKRLVALDQLMHRGVELYERKRPHEAMDVYKQVIAARPGMEVAYTQLAMLQWELGIPGDAIATLKDAMRHGGASVALQAMLGTYLAETGAVAEAIPLLEQATSGAGHDVEALNALGIALGRAGRMGDAARVFERLLSVNPSNAMALENLGTLAAAEGRLADASTYFRRALEQDPSSPQAHNGLGVVERRQGNRARAIEHWKQAVAGDPSNFDALYNLATELVNDGRRAEARPYLERFERTAPAAFYAADIARVRQLLANPAR